MTTERLISAIKERDYEYVKQLLNSINPNVSSDRGDIPINSAIFNKDYEMIEILIQRGADLNYMNRKNGRGYPPLWYAIYVSNFEMVKFLIDHGAKLVIDGQLCATVSGNLNENKLEILSWLIEHEQMDVNMKTITGDYLINDAYSFMWDEGVELLLNYGAIPS